MTPRQKGMVFLLISAMAAALWGVNYWGLIIRRQAVENWLEKANEDAQRITATSLNGISLFQTQLRGVATLFYGSQVVVQDEFLDTIDIVEGLEVEAMVPLTSIAYAEQRPSIDLTKETEAGIGRFPVTLSSDTNGLLAIGHDLADHPQVYSALRSALLYPEKVVQGPVFRGENNHSYTTFCVTAPNAGKPGVLLSIVDISNFLDNLGILYIPEGLNLRIVERGAKGEGSSDSIIYGSQKAPVQTVATAYIPTQSGHERWDYFWDILPSYAGGPSTALGIVIQFGGSALVLAMFAIISFLLLQNIQVNRIVTKRTEDLVVATKAAETANAAKSVFLACMSHEIRTPLNIVIGLTSIVLKSELTAVQRDYLGKVRIASNNLLKIIDEILDFSKVEAGRMDIEKHPFDLDQLMEQLSKIFSDRAAQKDLELIFKIAPDVHRQLIGDAARVTQVLTNLVENAVKFTEAGKIEVGAETQVQLESRKGQTVLEFRVRDTGIGIAANDLPTIFEPFTQTEGYLTRKHEGTGLGLAICRRLVELMGGRIWAESAHGEGSTFFFTVPFEAQSQQKPPVRLPAQVQGLHARQLHEEHKSAERPPARLAGQRVLLVEDSALSREVAAALLQDAGLIVETAENGRIAVDMVTGSPRGHYNLVLMDIQMPVMDGYEATRKIREFEKHRETTCAHSKEKTLIIALTAHALKGEKEKCLNAEMNDYLTKPLEEQELRRVLHKWMASPQTE